MAAMERSVTFASAQTTSIVGPRMLECAPRRAVRVRICVDCNAWLSLGPANDVGIAAEIRAAEMIQDYSDTGIDPKMSLVEIVGWIGTQPGADPAASTTSDAWHAGYLFGEYQTDAEIGDEEIRAAMTTSVINDDELTGLVLGCRSEG